MQDEAASYTSSRPQSRRLQEQATRYLPGGSSRGTAYFDPHPFWVERGEGHYLYDVDGHRYLDFMINATSLIMGHAHPAITEALTAQAANGVAFSAPAEPQVVLARELCERLPSVDLIRFTSSGTEATLNAFRAARAYTGRHKIAKFEGGYHGSHEYASISVHPGPSGQDGDQIEGIPEFPGMPPEVLEGVVILPYNDLEMTERILRRHHDQLACVVMEAVSSKFGYAPSDPPFLSGVRELTEELDILLVFDEVQSFRVARGGAQVRFDIVPDLTALGKIIGGGMPVGAFGGREDIMSMFDPSGGGPVIPHAGTFNANPMTMAAGHVTMNHLTPEVYARLDRLGEMLRGKLRAIFDELGVEGQVTGMASLFGIHFTPNKVTDYRTAVSADTDMAHRLFTGLLNEGVLLQSGCAGALNILTAEVHVNELVAAVRRVVGRLCA